MPGKNFIIPAIDIIDGKLVRLTHGDYAKQTLYDKDPLTWAKLFEDAGLKRLHLVDLDGAKKRSIQNLSILESIARHTSLVIDFGGGIKSREDIVTVLNAGTAIVTIGSIAVKQPGLLEEWVSEFGADKFFIGADVMGEQIKINGWLDDGNIDICTFIAGMKKSGLQHFFCTDISKDGALQGPASDLYKKVISAFPGISVTASGGVSSMNDIDALQHIGCSAVIVGKAIYENNITLNDLEVFQLSSV